MRRIGIYAGTFDPVHVGHITFALQALKVAHLDMVYFMPEREPRRKTAVEHYGHRYAMLRRAVRPHPGLAVLDTTDKHFSVGRTLPRLQHEFGTAELVFLMGSDVAEYLPYWNHIAQLVQQVSFCVGMRQGADKHKIEQVFRGLHVAPKRVTFVNSFAADISSSKIRDAIRAKHSARGVLMSVYRYAQREWLYL